MLKVLEKVQWNGSNNSRFVKNDFVFLKVWNFRSVTGTRSQTITLIKYWHWWYCYARLNSQNKQSLVNVQENGYTVSYVWRISYENTRTHELLEGDAEVHLDSTLTFPVFLEVDASWPWDIAWSMKHICISKVQ